VRDQVARNEWMCMFHAKYEAQVPGSEAELTPRRGKAYTRNREAVTVTSELQGLKFHQGQESAKVVQKSFVSAPSEQELCLSVTK
jgi:hypothetical protein